VKNGRKAKGNGGKERRAPGARSARGGAATIDAPGKLVIRRAKPKDAESVWKLLQGLAVYEKLGDRVTGSARQLARHMAGPKKIVDIFVAEQDGDLIGYAMYYLIYSSFRTQPMMWLEDLFVQPERRGTGAGRELIHAVARDAERLGCWRLSWAVLEWNEPAIGFYERLGAKRDEGGWYVYKFDEAKLKGIAGEARVSAK
jgi:GNAT superfamily N-acetyltransferase